MKIEDLINDYVEERKSILLLLDRTKRKYYSNETDSYDSFHLKYLIGFYEGQLLIINDVLKFFDYREEKK